MDVAEGALLVLCGMCAAVQHVSGGAIGSCIRHPPTTRGGLLFAWGRRNFEILCACNRFYSTVLYRVVAFNRTLGLTGFLIAYAAAKAFPTTTR